MCECDNPGCQNNETFFQDQNAKIEQYGHTYLAVMDSEESPGFIYSIGLSEKGMHDLIFIGASRPNALNYIAAGVIAQKDGATLEPGIIEPETGMNPFKVRMALVENNALAGTHAFSSARRLEAIESGKPVKIMQVVMPDMDGLFPWEDGYNWLDQQITENPFL